MSIRSVTLTAITLLSAPVLGQPTTQVVRPVPLPPMRAEGVGMASTAPTTPPDFRGVLDDNDTRREGKPADSYSVQLREGNEVTVTMTADDFDTYLVVRAPNGREWENDDFGGTQTSQVTFTASAGGMYTVVATAYSEDGRGDYEVRVQAATPTVVSTASGRLDYQDTQQIKGEFYDTMTLRAPSSGEFYVDLMALGFTGYLRVASPSGVLTSAQQEYGEGETPVRIGPLQGESGTWTVDVTSVGTGEVGAYDVRVITLGAQR